MNFFETSKLGRSWCLDGTQKVVGKSEIFTATQTISLSGNNNTSTRFHGNTSRELTTTLSREHSVRERCATGRKRISQRTDETRQRETGRAPEGSPSPTTERRGYYLESVGFRKHRHSQRYYWSRLETCHEGTPGPTLPNSPKNHRIFGYFFFWNWTAFSGKEPSNSIFSREFSCGFHWKV